jgi:hypothetical protein
MVLDKASKKERRKANAIRRQREEVDVQYRAERDAVLRSLDVEQLIAHFIKWKRPVPHEWGGPNVALAVMHRARLALPSFTYAEKLSSAQWLVAHHYKLPLALDLRDGVLLGAKYDPH